MSRTRSASSVSVLRQDVLVSSVIETLSQAVLDTEVWRMDPYISANAVFTSSIPSNVMSDEAAMFKDEFAAILPWVRNTIDPFLCNVTSFAIIETLVAVFAAPATTCLFRNKESEAWRLKQAKQK